MLSLSVSNQISDGSFTQSKMALNPVIHTYQSEEVMFCRSTLYEDDTARSNIMWYMVMILRDRRKWRHPLV